MPIYTYRCNKCNGVFEIAQKITDSPIVECVICAGSVQRLIQPVGVIFNGPGFHVNDYRKKEPASSKES